MVAQQHRKPFVSNGDTGKRLASLNMELHSIQFRNGLHQFLKGLASMGKAIQV